jgi:hypothetical protein
LLEFRHQLIDSFEHRDLTASGWFVDANNLPVRSQRNAEVARTECFNRFRFRSHQVRQRYVSWFVQAQVASQYTRQSKPEPFNSFINFTVDLQQILLFFGLDLGEKSSLGISVVACRG